MLRRTTLLFVSFLLLFGLLVGLTQEIGSNAQGGTSPNTQSAGDDGLPPSDIERAASKMDEALLSQLRKTPTEPVTAIVRMGGQVDFTPALSIQSREARSVMVYKALQVKAERSQQDIRTFLDDRISRWQRLRLPTLFHLQRPRCHRPAANALPDRPARRRRICLGQSRLPFGRQRTGLNWQCHSSILDLRSTCYPIPRMEYHQNRC